jgi:hypothetical protein
MALSNLTQLIHGLKAGEVQLIRNYYNSMVTLKDATKRLQLFDIIKSDKKATDEFASQKLYKCKPNSAYSQLKRRLKEDMLNILLLQDSKRRYNTPFARAEFDVRRMIIEGDILLSRGITKEGINTLNKASVIADEYELYNESILINELLLGELSFIKGAKGYDKYKDKISKSLLLLEANLKAKTYYHKIIVPHLFKLSDSNVYKEFAAKASEELKSDFERTKSKKIGYYYYYISTLHYNLEKNYKNAYECALKFLEINTKSKSVSSKRSIASAYLQLCYINLFLGNYKASIKDGENALKNFQTGLSNELTTLELLFLAHFYNNDAKKAEQVLQRALTHPKLNSNKFLPAKWHY